MKPYPEIPPGIVVEHDGPVLRIRLNRPERRNSLTDPIVYALTDLVDAAASDESVRVIHLEGTGDHFCSGFDLAERTSGPDRPRVGSIHRRMNGHVNRLIPAMLTCQTPIVCAARGWIIGLGLDLLLASDFAVVADDARLWAPFTTFGFTPDSGATWLIPRLAGVARAREMLMLGEKVTGTDAAVVGIGPPIGGRGRARVRLSPSGRTIEFGSHRGGRSDKAPVAPRPDVRHRPPPGRRGVGDGRLEPLRRLQGVRSGQPGEAGTPIHRAVRHATG